jgi:hypothetical protein
VHATLRLWYWYRNASEELTTYVKETTHYISLLHCSLVYGVCAPILLLELWSISRCICQEPCFAQGPLHWVPLFPPLFPTLIFFFRPPIFPLQSNKSNETDKRKHLSNSIPNSVPSSFYVPFLPHYFHLSPYLTTLLKDSAINKQTSVTAGLSSLCPRSSL